MLQDPSTATLPQPVVSAHYPLASHSAHQAHPSHSHSFSHSQSHSRNTSLSIPSTSSISFQPSNLTTILLLSNFSNELKTRDIQSLFAEWEDDRGGFKIKWIDDVSCYLVFMDPSTAKRAYLSLLPTLSSTVLSANPSAPAKLTPYTGADVSSILASVASRPRSRSIASMSGVSGPQNLPGGGGSHSRKSSLINGNGAGGAGMGHMRKSSGQGFPAGASQTAGGGRSWNQPREQGEGGPLELDTSAVGAGVGGAGGDGWSPPILAGSPTFGDAARRHLNGALGGGSISGGLANGHRKSDSRSSGADSVAASIRSLTIEEDSVFDEM